jgi:hypothetical protein
MGVVAVAGEAKGVGFPAARGARIRALPGNVDRHPNQSHARPGIGSTPARARVIFGRSPSPTSGKALSAR